MAGSARRGHGDYCVGGNERSARDGGDPRSFGDPAGRHSCGKYAPLQVWVCVELVKTHTSF
eukprot:6830958-Pyramimonas_sp.AAC.1